jgi:hypothetical protein
MIRELLLDFQSTQHRLLGVIENEQESISRRDDQMAASFPYTIKDTSVMWFLDTGSKGSIAPLFCCFGHQGLELGGIRDVSEHRSDKPSGHGFRGRHTCDFWGLAASQEWEARPESSPNARTQTRSAPSEGCKMGTLLPSATMIKITTAERKHSSPPTRSQLAQVQGVTAAWEFGAAPEPLAKISPLSRYPNYEKWKESYSGDSADEIQINPPEANN